MDPKVELLRGHAPADSLAAILRLNGVPVEFDALRLSLGNKLPSTDDIVRIVRHQGLKSRAIKSSTGRLARTPLPAIGWDRDGNLRLILKVADDRVLVQAGSPGRPEVMNLAEPKPKSGARPKISNTATSWPGWRPSAAWWRSNTRLACSRVTASRRWPAAPPWCASANRRWPEFQDGVLGDLAKPRTQASELEANLSKAEQRLALDTLRSPIDGTVENLAVHTVGGVVTPAQALMLVVPDTAQLVVEAGVENKDVGFVHPGQRAEIKVETFAFTRYGMIDGTVQALSRDAVLEGGDRKETDRRLPDEGGDEPVVKPASYMARIALDRNWIDTEAGRMTLGAGMSVTAEIYTGKRRIIGFLLSPLQRVVGESGHERESSPFN